MSLPQEIVDCIVDELRPRIVVGGLVGSRLDSPGVPWVARFERRFVAPMRTFSATLHALALVDTRWNRMIAGHREGLLVVAAPSQLRPALRRFEPGSSAASAVRTLIVGPIDRTADDPELGETASKLIAACVKAVEVAVHEVSADAQLSSACRTFCIPFASVVTLQTLLVKAAAHLRSLYVGMVVGSDVPDRLRLAPPFKRLRTLETGTGSYWRVIGRVVNKARTLRTLRLDVEQWSAAEAYRPFRQIPIASSTVTCVILDSVWPPDEFSVQQLISWLPASVARLALGWPEPPARPTSGFNSQTTSINQLASQLEDASLVPGLQRIQHIPPPVAHIDADLHLQAALVRLAAACAFRDIDLVALQPGSSLLQDL